MLSNVILESGTVKTNTQLDISFLKSDIYFVFLANHNQTSTKKIILIDSLLLKMKKEK